MRYALIMAGGAGTRLWPMSRLGRPKQLLPLIPDTGTPLHDHHDSSPPHPAPPAPHARSLLAVSADRLDGLIPPDRRYVCTGESYRQPVRDAIPWLSDDQILGEPVGRDTVNAVGFGAAVLHKLDPDAVMAVFTADHLIAPADDFRALVDLGCRLVEADPNRLVTFSIKPTYPATGFGYVERGSPISGVPGAENLAFRVARFVEKPRLEHAQAYVDSGMFGWNSGMFVWRAATFLDCLRRFKPESYQGLRAIADAWGTPHQQRTLHDIYPTLPKISVDYAVMEPASKDNNVQVCTVLMDLSWLDVGSWPSYAETLTPDAHNNRLGGPQTPRAVLVDSSDNLVVSDNPAHTIALLGCEGLVVVHTPDATLVMPRDRAEDLKKLHAQVDPSLR